MADCEGTLVAEEDHLCRDCPGRLGIISESLVEAGDLVEASTRPPSLVDKSSLVEDRQDFHTQLVETSVLLNVQR